MKAVLRQAGSQCLLLETQSLVATLARVFDDETGGCRPRIVQEGFRHGVGDAVQELPQRFGDLVVAFQVCLQSTHQCLRPFVGAVHAEKALGVGFNVA